METNLPAARGTVIEEELKARSRQLGYEDIIWPKKGSLVLLAFNV
jgi:hypothetical protein